MSINPETNKEFLVKSTQESSIAQLISACRETNASADGTESLKQLAIERLSQKMMTGYLEPMRHDLANILEVDSEYIQLSIEITAQATYWRVVWRVRNLSIDVAKNPNPQPQEQPPVKLSKQNKAIQKKGLPKISSKERRVMSLLYSKRLEFLKSVKRERGGSTQPTSDGFVTLFSILF